MTGPFPGCALFGPATHRVEQTFAYRSCPVCVAAQDLVDAVHDDRPRGRHRRSSHAALAPTSQIALLRGDPSRWRTGGKGDPPQRRVELRRRWELASPAARARGQAANRRLPTRWTAFDTRKKRSVIANVAIARELAGWCWSLAFLENEGRTDKWSS